MRVCVCVCVCVCVVEIGWRDGHRMMAGPRIYAHPCLDLVPLILHGKPEGAFGVSDIANNGEGKRERERGSVSKSTYGDVGRRVAVWGRADARLRGN